MRSTGPCVKIVDLCRVPVLRCGHPGHGVSLSCPAGRPDAVGGPYCEEHGGQARAQREADGDWNYQAPASVGDAAAVQDAGTLSLNSRDAYLVIRREAAAGDRAADRWLAYLGVGSLMLGVRAPVVPGAKPPHRKRGEHMAVYQARAALGGYAFASREEALAVGARAWREHLDASIAQIRRARGGTLAWGVPVEPLDDPIIVDVGPGQNAWDVAAALPRRGRLGLAALAGLRPSGEAA